VSFVLQLITALFKSLLPFLWEKVNENDTLKDAQPLPDSVRESLYDRVRNHPGYNHRI